MTGAPLGVGHNDGIVGPGLPECHFTGIPAENGVQDTPPVGVPLVTRSFFAEDIHQAVKTGQAVSGELLQRPVSEDNLGLVLDKYLGYRVALSHI